MTLQQQQENLSAYTILQVHVHISKVSLTIVILYSIRVQLLRHTDSTSREVRIVGHSLPQLRGTLRWVKVASQKGEDVILYTRRKRAFVCMCVCVYVCMCACTCMCIFGGGVGDRRGLLMSQTRRKLPLLLLWQVQLD